jgi:hypothetical protein
MSAVAVEARRPKRDVLSAVWAFVRYHVLTLYSFLFFAYLLLPIAIVVAFSFNHPTGNFNFTWQGFTWDNWHYWDGVPGIRSALVLSLQIAFLASLVATILGTAIALALVRYGFRGRGATNILIFLPLSTPEIVLGASLLTLFLNLNVVFGFCGPAERDVQEPPLLGARRRRRRPRDRHEASLDAGDEETFAKINRPHKGIHFDAVVSGLVNFRKEYAGQVWLEVFMIEDINTSDSSISNIRKQIALIRPDKVQLNTAVRPTTETGIRAISPDRMEELAKKIGFNAEVIADFAKATSRKLHASESSIIEMLQRRPCSLNDICSGLGIPADEAVQLITNLTKQSRITSDDQNGTIFFKIA